MSLFRTKSVEQSIAETEEPEHRLKKNLGALDLIIFGVGVTIGAGIFVLTGTVAATNAGPAIMFSFLIAGPPAHSRRSATPSSPPRSPVAGSAYTFSYATFGEIRRAGATAGTYIARVHRRRGRVLAAVQLLGTRETSASPTSTTDAEPVDEVVEMSRRDAGGGAQQRDADQRSRDADGHRGADARISIVSLTAEYDIDELPARSHRRRRASRRTARRSAHRPEPRDDRGEGDNARPRPSARHPSTPRAGPPSP